jgi:hypothetical protein
MPTGEKNMLQLIYKGLFITIWAAILSPAHSEIKVLPQSLEENLFSIF